ncbi:MAG TPA: peptide ABC transporter substrate-binding protein, partial [Lactobacillus sp.]|nr:peptide ABC transporter substrate-binding protein [Lactobacillus sp.]
MKTQQKWLVMMTAELTLVLAACGQSSAKTSSSASKQQVWHRMESDVLQTLDPSKASEGVSGQAIIDTMNGLYKYEGHDLQPAMATKIVKPTNNGLTYTFKLRNAKWSDGSPVTAQDFVFAWQRTVNPVTKSSQANMYSGIQNADDIRAGKKPASTLGVKALNDKTLEVTLEHPIPYFNSLLNNVAFYPQPAKQVQKWGDKYGSKSAYTLSNGAFKSKDWSGTGDKLV